MNIFAKIVSSLMFALIVAFGASAADVKKVNKYHVTFLDNYSQLSLNNGTDGIYFVKNASSSNALDRNGDPTVKTGWAMYVWDSRITTNNGATSGGWIKIAEGESLDTSAAEIALRNYVRQETRENDLAVIAATYLTKEEYQQHDPVGGMAARLTTVEGLVSSLSSSVSTHGNSITQNSRNIVTLGSRVSALENQTTPAGKDYIDSQDATTLSSAKSYTDTKFSDANSYVDGKFADATRYVDNTVSNYTDFAIAVISNMVVAGKFVYEFDSSVLDPVQREAFNESCVTCRAHVVNTLSLRSDSTNTVKSMDLYPETSRNYEVYIPNDQFFRKALPITIESKIDEVTSVVYETDIKKVDKLPIFLKVRQPRSDTILLDIRQLDDGTDWTPVIRAINVKYSSSRGLIHTGESSLEGENLQSVIECKVKYPISASETFITNLVSASVNGIGAYSSYDSIVLDYIPPSDKLFYFDGDQSYIEFLNYKTANGEAHFNCSRIVTLRITD